jgi:signal transduction histidine kinase/CheY-like chemotaxis protein
MNEDPERVVGTRPLMMPRHRPAWTSDLRASGTDAKDRGILTTPLTKIEDTLRAWADKLPQALAIGLGLMSADPEYAGHLRTAQIGAIIRLTPLTMGASCLNAVILLLTLGRIGSPSLALWIWSALVFALAAHYGRNWWASRHRDPNRQATSRTIRRAIIHGGLFGGLWGAVPVLTFPGAPALTQLLVGCLTAGMMCAGGFVLATVPLAGMAYVLLVAAGAFLVLLQDGSPVYLGLTALMVVYTAVIIVNLNWIAFLFISHFLAEAQVQREVTARERAQARAAHAERMIALGELAGGIAHDFNNILQAISGHAELLERRPEETQQVRRLAGVILKAAERGGSISHRLLAFARRDLLTIEPVDLAEVLKGLCEFVNHPFGSDIAIRVDMEPGLGPVLSDKAQLEVVLSNLATNARDAMPHGGALTFSAARETIAQDWMDPTSKPCRFVRISVADSGIGMDRATLVRATEPFFTTKPKGKGTGLGLSMAQGFAQQSGGALSIESAPGSGTVVSIWLPKAESAIRSPPEAVGQTPAVTRDLEHKQRVLVVDDDELVREAVMMSLEEAGFATEGAEDASRALAYLDQGETVDALITDFAMSGMNGLDLIREAQRRQPTLPAILLTGHVGDIAAPPTECAGGRRVTVLQKPVRPRELVERIDAAMRPDVIGCAAIGP